MVDTPKVRQASQSWPLPDHGREQYLYGLHTIIFYTFCFAGIITFSARDDAHPLQTQPPSCTLAHAQMDSGFPCTASTHNCTLLPRVSVRLSGTDTLLDIVAATTCADNRNRCFSEPLPPFICHFPALVRRPQTPTGTHQPFLCALQRSRVEEEMEADEMAKKSRPHDEGEAWAPAEAAHPDNDDESSSDEEDDPVQEDSGMWSMLDGDALIEAQLEAAQTEVDAMAARGAFNRCVDPVIPIVCFSDEGKGAFSEKSFADMLSGIIGSSKEVAMTVIADKHSKVVAYELSAPSSVADTIMRSTPAQRAGWRFWKRSEDPEELRRLPQKIANLHGLEVIRIQKLPTGIAAWNPSVQRIIAEWFVKSGLNDRIFAARLEHLSRCPSVACLSETEAAGWSAPGVELVSVSSGKIVSDYKTTTIITRLDLVVRATNAAVAGARFPFIPMEAAVPLKIEQKAFEVTLGADENGFSAGESNMSDKDKTTSYHYAAVISGKDPKSGKPTACKEDLLLLSAADGDFQLGNVEWCPNHGVNIAVLHGGQRCKPHRKVVRAQAVGRIQKEMAAKERQRYQAWIASNGSHFSKKDKNKKFHGRA